ncbi:hypothetical protein [Allobaculum sp. JKK-2023]|uniref:hypothetical protein n=1 Tax=Allobaculum sp. JKK-2023 TaxID=3108943 RepID=UPI002B059CE1|nr:hypothetical protein [Allobaculum sp. JKK-2023]
MFKPRLDEPPRRMLLGFVAAQSGYGSQKFVQNRTGVDPRTLEKVVRDYNGQSGQPRLPADRQTQLGVERKSVEERHPEILSILYQILDDDTYSDPQWELH